METRKALPNVSRGPLMRLPRPRLSIRMIMVAVAIVAVGLSVIHHRRSAAFRLRAADYAREAVVQAKLVRQHRASWEKMDAQHGDGATYLAWRDRLPPEAPVSHERFVDRLRQGLESHRALLAHFEGLEEKYRRAAAFPWLPVAPDPPPPIAGPTLASATLEPSNVPEGALAVVASLPRVVFELRENLVVGGVIPLTIEYRNRSDRPITVCPISLVVVTDDRGREAEPTGQGRSYRQSALSPSETRRKHSSIVIEPGQSYRDVGLDLTSLYRLPSGRYSVRVIHSDSSPGVISAPFDFEVRRETRSPSKPPGIRI